jgi:hypothetical protein
MTKFEGMTNGQMTNSRDVASSSFWLRASLVIRHLSFVICWSVVLMIIVQMCCSAPAQAQSPDMIGRWNVEINFGEGNKRALRFDAQAEGKGSFELLDPRAKAWGAPTHFEAKWTLTEANSVTFSGAVEFMLGNVGRDAGTLMFKGKFETPDSISGEVEFAPLVGDRPTRHGTFKATRAQ